ncbi:MAG: low molecular weight phosphatase family protein [Candidatus Micrarchaeota archaeon]
MKRVLFVCSHNSVRSPMAEAIYNHASRRSRASSAGIDPVHSVKTQAMATLSRRGISCQGLRPKRLTQQMIDSADKVVFLTKSHAGFDAPGSEEWDVPLPDSPESYDALFLLLRRKTGELAAKVDGA